MKLVGLPTLGIFGGIVLTSLGSFSFLDSAPTTALRHQLAAPSMSGGMHETSNRIAGNTPHAEKTTANSRPSDESSSAEATLRHKIDQLEQGRAYLNQVSDYTARILKQEVVGNELLEEQTILIKCRHEPFSVYLNWITGDPGREVIFVEGRNDGKMIAHDGRWKARLPAFYLDPKASLAMRDARYPVTSVGLLGLIETMLGIHREDLTRSNIARCTREMNQEFDGRTGDTFTLIYKSAADSPVYRKSITFIDREWHVPIQTRHFEWPRPDSDLAGDALDESTLIESYRFTEIQFQAGLTDRDFDHKNPEYRFR